jgi:hypothetical protein
MMYLEQLGLDGWAEFRLIEGFQGHAMEKAPLA